jgi:hypothetical protein
MYVCIRMYTYVCVYVCMCVCVYIYVYVYMYIFNIGDATCDPMYAPPEQKIQLLNPGKFDAFSVGMIGLATH